MKSFARIPGATLAVGAFLLTVLLGIGGVSASALWQQSATATMSVTANGAWPGPALASLTCTNSNADKTATLTVTLSAISATITYAAVQANGTLGPSYAGPVILFPSTSATIVLQSSPQPASTSQILKDNPAGPLTVRVTATYLDTTAASMDMVLNNSTNNHKIVCPVAPVPGRG